MEITERSLRLMVREVDELHRQGMQTIAEDTAALHSEAVAGGRDPSRRRFLRVAATGAAITVGGGAVPVTGLLGMAGAQALDDHAIAVFAESIELAAVAAYAAAAKSGKVTTPAVLAAAATFAGHHKQHAQAFGALAGDAAGATPNPTLLQTAGDQIRAAADESAVLTIAFQLENGAAATYLFAISALMGPQALAATASILPVEAQHAAVLGKVLGKDLSDTDYLPPFQTQDQALQPSKFAPAS